MIKFAPILNWRIAVVCGLLWGCALAGLELSVEFGEWPGLRSLANAAIGLTGIWCLTGVGWAVLTRLAEPSTPASLCVGLWLAGSVLFTAVQVGAIKSALFAPAFDEISDFPIDAIAVHVLWLNGFYGGIYLVGYLAFGRSVRSRRLVSRLQRVLSEEAALASEARLRTARTQLQPKILVEALAAAKAHYRSRPSAADAIVGRLIRFLRVASGTHASRRSTLDNELTLAASYIKLQAVLRGGLDGWTVNLTVPAPALPFPPRVLVPLVERLGHNAALLALTSGYSAAGFFIQISAKGHLTARTRQIQDFPLEASDPLLASGNLPWTFALSKIETGQQWTALAAPPIEQNLYLSSAEGNLA